MKLEIGNLGAEVWSTAGCLLLTVSCLLAGVAAPIFAQGPLTPPGPPATTMKTLQEIEPRTPITHLPFTITEPGSYYFVSNLVAEAGFNTNAITVDTDDVTIDLNGFSLVGVSGAQWGVYCLYGNLAVRNGVIKNWLGAIGSLGPGGHFDSLRVEGCSGSFVLASVQGGLIDGCQLVANSGGLANGLNIQGNIVRDTTMQEHTSGAIVAGYIGIVARCASHSNSGDGGIGAAAGITKDCVASDNRTGGIRTGDGIISGCEVSGVTGSVFSTGHAIRGFRALLVENRASLSEVGLWAGGGAYALRNVVFSNAVGVSATVSRNFIAKNAAYGNATNYNVIPGISSYTNRVGPIDSGVGSPINNAWANFEY